MNGLHGDREATWTCDIVFWPKDLLSVNIPGARIVSFGYDAKVAHLWSHVSQNNVRDKGDSLVVALVGLRSNGVEVVL